MELGTRIFARPLVIVSLAAALLAPGGISARTLKQKKAAARAQFATAERLREALNGQPQSERTRRDYLKVIEAYRKVYYTAPSSVKADPAVVAVAELLDEQGRVLHDTKSFHDAIGQYEFLRREYPGSTHRVEALFTIAEIYRDDLNDTDQAQASYQELVKRYPGSSLAAKARQALAEIGDQQVGGNPFKKKSGNPVKTAKAGSPHKKRAAALQREHADAKPAAARTRAEVKQVAAGDSRDKQPESEPQKSDAAESDSHRLPRLTGIRHWSTPDYTRVAIDLEQEVKYEAGRVQHPDRIFFDLHGTRLASDLVGKSFDVDDSGFLHRIRVAQYNANLTRVVLDVDDVEEYSAFLLPNPYRLIIDIHGKLPARQTAGKLEEQKPAGQSKNPAESKEASAKLPAGVTDASPEKTAGRNAPAHASPKSEKSADEKTMEAAHNQPAPASDKKREDAGTIAADTVRHVASSGEDSADHKNRKSASSAPDKLDSPKVIDDTRVETADKATRKPTSGPTFEAIGPRQSGRRRKKTVARAELPASTTHTAAPTANGDRSLIRALGLKIGKIVIDAGHGGHDTGTIGPNGLLEKDLVLDVALKLGKLLEDKMGAEVVYTRDDDTFVPLETRTGIANKEEADLFISIHANSSHDPSARGVETYYLNFTSSADALEVAARENAVSDKSIHELQDLVKKIALKEKIEESREFASDVQRSLYSGLNARSPGLRNRGVKKAPFIVLIGANMPSILAEISFVSNPADARKLSTEAYRQRIANSLYKGISKYVSGLSGVKVASRLQRQKQDSESGSSSSTLASK